MKPRNKNHHRFIFSISFFTYFLISLFLFSYSFAQSDKQSDDILKGVSAKYKSFTSVKADFSYTVENAKDKTSDTQQGSISLKADKYKLNIKGQEVICDGKTVWTYLKDANEVQVSDPNTKEDAINPTNIFTMYEKGFDHIFVEEKPENGKSVQVIDLKPTDAKKNYFKIRMTIDKNEKLLMNFKVFNKDGSHQIYSIKQFIPNAPLTDSVFMFDKATHPKVEVIDLR